MIFRQITSAGNANHPATAPGVYTTSIRVIQPVGETSLILVFWSHPSESNRRPTDYESQSQLFYRFRPLPAEPIKPSIYWVSEHRREPRVPADPLYLPSILRLFGKAIRRG
jgi:hypothetical protein